MEWDRGDKRANQPTKDPPLRKRKNKIKKCKRKISKGCVRMIRMGSVKESHPYAVNTAKNGTGLSYIAAIPLIL